MKKFSIIIPMYNAEKTIRRCLDSIKYSNYDNYEVLLIDDGSTDKCKKIAMEYANGDERFKLFSQTNAGPSAARNVGLDKANGDIISFIDSDDYIRKDYFEQLDKAFDDETLDVVFFGFWRVDDQGNKISEHLPPELQSDYFENLINLSVADMFGYTWIKAFRRRILKNKRFEIGVNLFEDELFTCNLLARPQKLCFLKESIYYYVRFEGTLATKTHSNYCILCDNVFNAWRNLLSIVPNKSSYLNEKANHLAVVCKYYGLERKVKTLSFYKDMSICEFMKYVTSQDQLINCVKEKKWNKIRWLYWKYNMKIAISSFIKKGK